MSFRKRNVVVSSPGSIEKLPSHNEKESAPIPGVRPSPLDGRLTTSTGTRSLDALFAGHAGLPLGTSLLIGESGTTDFSGALLRYYAAEGIVQGHFVHVLGVTELWARELPGVIISPVAKSTTRDDEKKLTGEKMKIAWRYERLGEFGRDRLSSTSSPNSTDPAKLPFCHEFDLSKRLALPSSSLLRCMPLASTLNFESQTKDISISPFNRFLHHLSSELSSTSPSTIHRVVVPTLFSPALYPHTTSIPGHVIQFFHALRSLLRKYPEQLTALITLPLSLHPRSTGLTRWLEILSDGVLELSPFPSHANMALATNNLGSATAQEESPQGMLKMHRIPIYHEKGGGGGESSGHGDDLAFTLSRRKGLVIKPFSLPPVDGDTEAQQGGLEGDHGRATKADIDF